MAYKYRGKTIGFDNIAAGSATGVERHIAGGGRELTSKYGGQTQNLMSACGSSHVVLAKEFLWKTVCSGQTSDRTTDKDPGF
jgi:hypothetical protein